MTFIKFESIILVTDISGRSKPYDNCITRNLKSKQKRGNFMKVKLKKHKKSPAPLVVEQVISIMAKSEPNLYSVVQKAICDKDLTKKGTE